MKKINLLFLSCLLVGCNNTKITGTWEDIIAPTITAIHGGSVNPFNTSMSLKYFFNDELEDKENILENVKTIYQSNVVELHKKFDRHNSYYLDNNNHDLGKYKNIKDVNASLNSNEYVKLDKETFEMLKLGVEYSKYTNGYFNIFCGEITDFWDEVFSDAQFNDISKDPFFSFERRELLEELVDSVPNPSQMDEVLIFDEETCSVKFNSLIKENKLMDKISISIGGIAKGVATDMIKKILLSNGYETGYLFSGGSSVTSLKDPIYDNGKGQYISVLDPRTSASLFEKKKAFGIYLKDEFSMSTSGNYTSGKSYSFIDKDTNDYITRHHIVNSYTGYPEYKEGIASISIFSKKLDAGILDAFSTALFNMSIDNGLKFREKVKQDYACDFEIIYIKENIKEETIEVISTSNFNKTLELSDSKGITLKYV